MQFISEAAGDPARHSSPTRLLCGSNHSILCGLVLGYLIASSLVCHAVHVRLMVAPKRSLLDGKVEEILITGSPGRGRNSIDY